jgi:hypothetical protein
MDPFLRWIESTPLSVWTRESTSVLAFPAILSAHAIGMALAAGVNAAIALHLLGVGAGIPTRELRRFVGVLWIGFWMNAASGVLLLVAYPTKALTNPVFYVKLLLIATGIGIFVVINRRLFRDSMPGDDWVARPGRFLAVASLVCWAGAITAGRLLAYTHRRLLVDF